jgi:aryl-alcohol dehydrogenase-like predicted oxidoreductase
MASREGKIKYIGLCGVSSNTLRRAYKITPVDVVQVEYSPFVLDIEQPKSTELLKTCRELNIGIVAYSPLGRGLLTGTHKSRDSLDGNDIRINQMPRFSADNIEANAKLVEQFKVFADKKGCSTSQLAIAWVLKQGDDVVPIPGTRKIKYLEENWASLKVHLTAEDEAEIRKFVENAEIKGDTESEASKMFAFVDTKEERA